MYQLTCKNHAMYIEALRAIEALGVDYEAQPEEITIDIENLNFIHLKIGFYWF